MGFRNEEDARFHRILALEAELEERDRKIAALEAKLDGKNEPPIAKEGDDATSAAAANGNASAPMGHMAGDTWVIPTHRPRHNWHVDLVSLLAMSGMGAFLAVESGVWTDAWPALIFAAPGLIYFYQQRLTLDRRAGTVTRTRSLLFIRWNRVVTYAGKELLVERGSGTAKNGEPYDTGTASLDGMKLFSKKMEPADALAQRIAAFLDIPCRTVTPTAKQLQRRARLPFVLMFGVAALLVVAAWFLRAYLLR